MTHSFVASTPRPRTGLWARRLLVTAAVAATVPFLIPPPVDVAGLGPVWDAIQRAARPLAVLAISGASVLALVLIWSRGDRGGRDLAVFLACAALTLSLAFRGALVAGATAAGLDALALAVWTLAAVGMVRFAVTFPEPATLEDVNRAMALGRSTPAPSRTARGVWWLFERAWWVGGTTVALVSGVWLWGGANAREWAGLLVVSLFSVLMLIAIAVPPRLYRKAKPERKRQMLWVALGIHWGLMMFPTLGLASTMIADEFFAHGPAINAWLETGGASLTMFAAGGVVLVACLAIAVFGHGLFDPRLALKRSVVYGGAGLLLVFLFAVVEEAAQSLVLDRLGVASTVSSWVAGAAAALAFGPLRKWLEGRTESWFAAGGVEPDEDHAGVVRPH